MRSFSGNQQQKSAIAICYRTAILEANRPLIDKQAKTPDTLCRESGCHPMASALIDLVCRQNAQVTRGAVYQSRKLSQ